MSVSSRQILDVFSRNLKILVASEPSVSALCRKLEINRSQFNRYLTGEASPRPLVLYRICEHFGVDARILLQPLSEIAAPTSPLAEFDLKPASTDILPDGLYGMWIFNRVSKPDLSFRLRLVTTEGEMRRTRSKAEDLRRRTLPGTKRSFRLIRFDGYAFSMRHQISMIETTDLHSNPILTAMHPGSNGAQITFTGIRLASVNVTPGMHHTCMPVFMERLPRDRNRLSTSLRQQRELWLDDAPQDVRNGIQTAILKGFGQHDWV